MREGLPVRGDILAGKYEIRRVLGEGGMGVVLEAYHRRLRQQVAIKFLQPRYAHDPAFVARFDREVRAAAQLRGIHVVRVIDVDTTSNGTPYMVQEYLDGRDLGAELATTGPLPVVVAVDYVLQAALGMIEAHEVGIVHRDLKPANLFLSNLKTTPRRLVRVLDFGISRLLADEGPSDKLTQTDTALGTMKYMSPEQLKSSHDVDGRADVWSLGVILFELLTGRTPYVGRVPTVALAIVMNDVPRPTEFRADIPRELEEVIMRALQKEADARFASMKELAEALAPFGPTETIATLLARVGMPRVAGVPGDRTNENEAVPLRDPTSDLETLPPPPDVPDQTRPGSDVESQAHARLGTTLSGKYRIDAILSVGRMTVVYAATHQNGKRFAVKMLHMELSLTKGLPERFVEEAYLANTIAHSNAPAILDDDIADDGATFVVMELLEGQTVEAIWKSHAQTLPAGAVLAIAHEALDVLAAAHRKSIIHRDIKPANLFVLPDGRVKVLDFKIARLHGVANPDTNRSDIWAVGATMFTLLSGELVHREGNARAATRPARSLGTVASHVPEAVVAIVDKALAFDESSRWETAEGMRDAIRDAYAVAFHEPLSTAPIRALLTLADDARSPKPATRVRESDASLKRTALLAVGAALVASAAVAIVSSRAKPTTATPVSSGNAAAIVKECQTNAECMHSHANAAWICRKDDWKCAALESADCKVMAEPGDVENDRTIWIGAMFPTTGPQAAAGGINSLRAIDLVRRDFVQMTHGIPPLTGDAPPRPLAIVACDDSKENLRIGIAHHLADEVGVPAVIGFASSQEVIDLATSAFIPKRVLIIPSVNVSSLITAIPHPTGVPRLVWRTAISTAEVASPIGVVIGDMLEPRLRALPSVGMNSPLRLGLLRVADTSSQSLAGAVFEGVRFNGKTVLENEGNFREFVVKDSSASGAAEQREVVEQILKFRPHIILCSTDALTRPVFIPLEARWPTSESFKPYGLYPIGLGGLDEARDLFVFLGTSKERRSRFYGLETPSSTPQNAQLQTRFNETFPEKVDLNGTPAGPYDAMYLLAYAAVASDGKLTGPNLAQAIGRLLPPGKSVDVGRLHIFEAVTALRRGENLDLAGAMTPLNFDLSTGESPSDYVLTCAGVDGNGAALASIESGITYDAAAKTLKGALRCP